jgi:DNA-binding transcriptional LysR family regulator
VSFTGPAIQSWSFRDPATETIFEIPIVPRLTVTLGESVVEAAIRCRAVTRVPHYQCAAALGTGRLVRILRDYEKAPVPVHLIHASRGTMPLKMRTFLDFAVGRLRSGLSAMTAPDTVAP